MYTFLFKWGSSTHLELAVWRLSGCWKEGLVCIPNGTLNSALLLIMTHRGMGCHLGWSWSQRLDDIKVKPKWERIRRDWPDLWCCDILSPTLPLSFRFSQENIGKIRWIYRRNQSRLIGQMILPAEIVKSGERGLIREQREMGMDSSSSSTRRALP